MAEAVIVAVVDSVSITDTEILDEEVVVNDMELSDDGE